MPIPTIFFPSFLIWGSHSHFIEIKYTTRKPLEGTLFTLVHLLALRLTITTHFIYVFPSLVNDTHILGLALDVIPAFLWLQEELSALNLSMQSAKCVVWSPSRLDHFISLYLSFFYSRLKFLYFECTSGIHIICWIICGWGFLWLSWNNI
jgi:hypothetical protein